MFRTIFSLILISIIFWSCDDAPSKSNYITKRNGGWEVIYKDGILIDSAQVANSNGMKNGKRFEFDSLGAIKKMSWYKNDILHGLSLEFEGDRNIIKTWYQDGLKRGPSFLKNKKEWISIYNYFNNDTLFFESVIDPDSGMVIKKGRIFISTFDNKQDTMNIGDTLSLNIYLIPIPYSKALYSFQLNEKTKPLIWRPIDLEDMPFIHSFLLKELGNITSTYYVKVIDTIGNKELDRFKISLDYLVEE